MSTFTCEKIRCRRLNQTKMKMQCWGESRCVMQNKWINGLTTNHSHAPLPEQERMQALNVKELEPSSNIDLTYVSWWMSIRDVCRLKALITTKFSKEGCISLTIRRKSSHVAYKHDWSRCGPPSTGETYSKTGLSKIWNLEHKCETIKTQFLRKINGA
jgi:hypothetical protein